MNRLKVQAELTFVRQRADLVALIYPDNTYGIH
jgi:hypothetical protein